MTVTIYHNPACGTSRNTLAMIRESGEEPEVIEYLKTPPSRARLVELIAALGISPRYVNDLLSDENTSFQRHVLTERLAHCERDLSSPMLAHRHVGEIAFAWGFNDLSHFGRAFREHYGMSPRDWRQSKLPH